MTLINQINKLVETGEYIPVEMPYWYINESIRVPVSSPMSNNVYLRNFSQVSTRGPIFDYAYQQRLYRSKAAYIRNQIRWSGINHKFNSSSYKKAIKFLYPHICTSKAKFLIRFTRNLDWKRGAYGDDNSCWFGSKSGARKMLQNHNGFAVQVHLNNSEKTPYGRCWGVFLEKRLQNNYFRDVDYDNTLIVFNGYKRPNITPIVRLNSNNLEYTRSFADMIAYALNIKWGVSVNLTNNRYTSSGNFFINQTYGVLLSSSKTLFTSSDRRVELAYKEEEWARCVNCSRVLGQDLIEAQGHQYCPPCAEERLEMCCYDMNLYDRRHLILGPNNHFYHHSNVLLVKDFVRCFITDYIIFKKPETYLGMVDGEKIYITESRINNYAICACGNAVIPKASKECSRCAKKNKIAERTLKEIKFKTWLEKSTEGEGDGEIDEIPF